MNEPKPTDPREELRELTGPNDAQSLEGIATGAAYHATQALAFLAANELERAQANRLLALGHLRNLERAVSRAQDALGRL